METLGALMAERLSAAELMDRIHTHWPQAEVPETAVMVGLIRLNDLVLESTAKVLNKFSLTPAGFEVLVTLRALPQPREMKPSELAQATLITSGGMTKILKSLEARDWIERRADTADQRSNWVVLTSSGMSVVEDAMKAVNRNDKDILGKCLTPKDIEKLGRTLLRTVDLLEAR